LAFPVPLAVLFVFKVLMVFFVFFFFIKVFLLVSFRELLVGFFSVFCRVGLGIVVGGYCLGVLGFLGGRAVWLVLLGVFWFFWGLDFWAF